MVLVLTELGWNQNAGYGPAGKAPAEPDAVVVLEDVTESNSNVKVDIFPEIGSTNVPITGSVGETVLIELLPPILMLPPPTTVIPRAAAPVRATLRLLKVAVLIVESSPEI